MASIRKFIKRHNCLAFPKGLARKALKKHWQKGYKLKAFAEKQKTGFFILAVVKGVVILLWVRNTDGWCKNFLDDAIGFWHRKIFEFYDVEYWKYIGV